MRGDVYRLAAPRSTTGHEQAGRRFAIVVQSDALVTSTVLVAPTSTRAQPSRYRPQVHIYGSESRVLVEQTICVDWDRLGPMVGRLYPFEMDEVDRALRTVLNLL